MKQGWSKLSTSQKRTVAGNIMKAVNMLAGYDSSGSTGNKQREGNVVELTGEDGILKNRDRNKITNQLRQGMRNAPITRIIDQQLRVNVVGLKGGKLTLTSKNTDAAKKCQDWFNKDWAPQAEFTDKLHFNEVLKLNITSANTGGDVVLLFDDGTLCNSGRIRAFESDEVANFDNAYFDKRFQTSGYTQRQGRVYDRLGRNIGVIVSTSCRGRSTIPEGKGFFLYSDPEESRVESYWTMYRHVWRFNQGRGISPSSSSGNTLTDINEIVASETQSTKLNSKLFGQLVDSSNDEEPENVVPPEYRSGDTDGEDGETESLAALDEDEDPKGSAKEEIAFEALDAIGAYYDIMPPKLKMELLDTKRPNEKVIDFIDWLSGNASAVHGLGRIYVTLNPLQSYTAFRGAQCLSWPSIEEAQKDLERYICDWSAVNALRWGEREGKIKLPDDWRSGMSWQWPTMREVNEETAQKAFNAKIKNGNETYENAFGPDWKKRIDQFSLEVAYFKSKGLVHPAMETASGQVVSQ